MELFYVTTKGLEYFASTATGKKLCFTKSKFGDGEYTGETAVTALTDLINPLGEMEISKTEVNGNQVTITTQFSNKVDGKILNPFYLKEIGLYAKLTDENGNDDTANPETLVAYAYVQGEDQGDRIPGVLTEFIINWPCTVSNTSNVTVVINESLVYVTKDEFDEYTLTTQAAIDELDNVFVATYGETSWEEVKTAYDEGKVVFAKNGNVYFSIVACSSALASFSYAYGSTSNTVTLTKANGWSDIHSNTLATAEYVDSEIEALPIRDVTGITTQINGTDYVGGNNAVVIGKTEASNLSTGDYAVSAGRQARATGVNAISMGYGTEAAGNSVSMGYIAKSTGLYAVSIGDQVTSSGSHATTFGYYNTSLAYQTTIGKYSKGGTAGTQTGTAGDAFIIGNGTGSSAKGNAFRVTYAGKAYGLQSFAGSGADYAEYFEWLDGNPDNEDRRGRLVTLDGDKIRFATADDEYILGVISAAPCIEGDLYADDWQGKYLTDVFGKKLTQTVHIEAEYEDVESIDPETGEKTIEKILVQEEHDAEQWILNPDYDPEKEYTSREERPEWSAVGTMGKLVVVDDGTCEVNGYCTAGENGIATKTTDKNGYRVMSRIDDTHIKVWVR